MHGITTSCDNLIKSDLIMALLKREIITNINHHQLCNI